MPVAAHMYPGMQGIQAETLVAPVVFMYVPFGHGTGAALPAGQYEPTGHTSPTGIIANGCGVALPFTQ